MVIKDTFVVMYILSYNQRKKTLNRKFGYIV